MDLLHILLDIFRNLRQRPKTISSFSTLLFYRSLNYPDDFFERTVLNKKKSLCFNFIDAIRKGWFLYSCTKLFQLPTVQWFVMERIIVASERGFHVNKGSNCCGGRGRRWAWIKITNVFQS